MEPMCPWMYRRSRRPARTFPRLVRTFGFRHPAVQDIDAQLLSPFQHGLALLSGMPLHPFRAETYLTDHQAGLA